MAWHPGVNELERVKTRQLLDSALHWYRADTVTLSGANLATMPNRGTGGGAMLVTAGTISAPAADAQLGEQLAVTTSGVQTLQSSLPASDWAYLHQDSESYWVGRRVSDGASVFFATRPEHGYAGNGLFNGAFGGTRYVNIIFLAGVSLVWSTTYADIPIGAGMLAAQAFTATDHPRGFAYANGSYYGPSFPDEPTDGSAPTLPLTIGSTPSIQSLAETRFAEFLSFDRRLTPYERQLIQDYVRTRYGIALPTVTGIDREVLKLNPYSWIRADKYVENAGKVSALPDLVLPLHVMSQSTAANQCDVPVADAGFGGQKVLSFAGAQRYASTFPGDAWAFLSRGLGSSVHVPLRRNAGDVPEVVMSDGLAGELDWNLVLTATASVYMQVGSSYSLHTPSGFAPGGVPLVIHVRLSATESSQLIVQANGLQDSMSGTVPTGTPSSTMWLGSRQDGYGFGGVLAEALSLDRYPTVQDLATINAYYLQRYGLTP